MDRPLDRAIVDRQRLSRAAKVLFPSIGLGVLLFLLPGWMRPSLTRDRIRTSIVASGPIEAVITASGTVVPEIERVLPSPLEARVLRILKRPGAAVKHGEPIVVLDVTQSVLALDQLIKESKVKDNQQAQTRLGLEKTLAEIDGRITIQKVVLQTAEAKLSSQRQLFEAGLVARDVLRQTELEVAQTHAALAQLEADRRSTQQSTTLQFEGLALERASIERSIGEARRLLDLATAKADRDGVVTWVLAQEGALVHKGDVIARVADLTSYRVNASVSDVHTTHVRVGLPAVIKVNDLDVDGTVAEVLPTLDAGTLNFNVSLEADAHAALRPNLRVDVLIVMDRKARALHVRRGAFADGNGPHDVFVVRGRRAVRTMVELGLSAFDQIEVMSGLREGDEIIVSDMRRYSHLEEIALK